LNFSWLSTPRFNIASAGFPYLFKGLSYSYRQPDPRQEATLRRIQT
jgi:hypothetical protein